jgi:CelD/BcsL family acetyltransferase involved in cellulose biosynthesis
MGQGAGQLHVRPMLREPARVEVEILPPRAAARGLHVREVHDPFELELLREPWHELFVSAPEATPFASPEWLLPFAERFGKGSLRTLTVWRGQRLVGLAPFQIVPRAAGRTLSFVGAPITDYHSVLVAGGGAGRGVLEAVLLHLAEAGAAWDVADLAQLRPGDPLLSARWPADFSSELGEEEACSYVTLPRSGEALTAGFPNDLGLHLRRSLRRLRALEDLSFERADERSADELMDALFGLQADRWSGRHLPGALADAGLHQFHREVAAGMLMRGRLRLWGMRLGDRIEAVLYSFAHGRRIFAYLGAVNPVLAKWNPALVLAWSVMLASIDEGLEEMDFLHGHEPYESGFGARVRTTRRRIVRPI